MNVNGHFLSLRCRCECPCVTREWMRAPISLRACSRGQKISRLLLPPISRRIADRFAVYDVRQLRRYSYNVTTASTLFIYVDVKATFAWLFGGGVLKIQQERGYRTAAHSESRHSWNSSNAPNIWTRLPVRNSVQKAHSRPTVCYRTWNLDRLYPSSTVSNFHYNFQGLKRGSLEPWSPGAPNFLQWSPEPKAFFYLESRQNC